MSSPDWSRLQLWQRPAPSGPSPALPRSRPLPLASYRLVVIVTASLFVNSAALGVALVILARIG